MATIAAILKPILIQYFCNIQSYITLQIFTNLSIGKILLIQKSPIQKHVSWHNVDIKLDYKLVKKMKEKKYLLSQARNSRSLQLGEDVPVDSDHTSKVSHFNVDVDG